MQSLPANAKAVRFSKIAAAAPQAIHDRGYTDGHSRRRRLTPALLILFCGYEQGEEKTHCAERR